MSAKNQDGEPEVIALDSAEAMHLNAVTFQILDLKARCFALSQTMVSMGRELGLEATVVMSSIETLRRAELQRLLEVAEDKNPLLAAYLDSRKIEDL